jgi:hypothetical protein
MTEIKNHVNHIAFVLDASISMRAVSREMVEAADAEIAHLAHRSKEMGQETRITVYVFSDETRCVIYDMDVLRLPSLRSLYRIQYRTALVDAALLAIGDLSMTPQKYGDHAFLIYVFTDGQENASRAHYSQLASRIQELPDHWSLGVLVPDKLGEDMAARYGFPRNNIAQWDATTGHGVQEGVGVVRAATERFMQSRKDGVRGSRNLFSTGDEAVNKATITAAALQPLPITSYSLVPVPEDATIRDFIEQRGVPYRTGMAHYQFTKTETIQSYKKLAVVHKTTNQVFTGPQVRDLLNLRTDVDVRVRPNHNREYDIYVQSTSVNRRLKAGTNVLLVTS